MVGTTAAEVQCDGSAWALGGQTAWVRILALPPSVCVTFGKSLVIYSSVSSTVTTGMVTDSTSQCCCKGYVS